MGRAMALGRGAVVFAMLAVHIVAVPVASAACNPGRTNDGVGHLVTHNRVLAPLTTGGVYANVLNYDPYVYPSDEHTYGTVGFDRPTTPQSTYAMIGWLEFANSARNTFIQYTKVGGGITTVLQSPRPVGTYTYYTVLWNPSTDTFTFQVAGSTVKTAPESFQPLRGFLEGAIRTLASQMPGGSSAREWFNDAHIYFNGWTAFNASTTSFNSTYFAAGKSTTLNHWMYDKACTT